MASIDSLKASNGSGSASVATIQNVRSAGATTLIVDTVQNINDNFYGTMGTPHTFVDPVTAEEITVISEATAVDFKGHVDGTNLEIDTIAPGFVDGGSSVNDIVIIKPTTQWADEVAEVLEVSHNDDGTLKDDIVEQSNIAPEAVGTVELADGAVTPDKRSGGFYATRIILNSTTGSQSFTGFGFKPKLIQAMTFRTRPDGSRSSNGYAYDTGSGITQGAMLTGNATATSTTVWAFVAPDAIASSTPVIAASVTSFDSDGITINIAHSAAIPDADRTFHLIAFA